MAESSALALRLSTIPNTGGNGTQDAQQRDKQERPATNESTSDPKEGAYRQRKSIQTLADGHSALKNSLERCKADLQEKENCLKELEEEISRQRNQNTLILERIQCTSEETSRFTEQIERFQKLDDDWFKDVVEMKWKVHQACQFLAKLEIQRGDKTGVCTSRVREIIKLENIDKLHESTRQIREGIEGLKYYQIELAKGNVQFCAILNGNKMLELEQRKRAFVDDIEERNSSLEQLRAGVREKSGLLESKKKSRENTKAFCGQKLNQLKSKLRYLVETEHRLERSQDYLLARMKYGMNVPKPPPWPDNETLLSSRKFKCSNNQQSVWK